jgi:uncharacterized membrane protein
MTGRFLLASLACIGGFFFLGIKLLNPTPLVIWSTQTDFTIQSSYLGDVFTITDVIVIVIASLVVSASALYLLLYDRMMLVEEEMLKSQQQTTPIQPPHNLQNQPVPNHSVQANYHEEAIQELISLIPTPLEERKARWETNLLSLREDQKVIYQAILDEDGMMAQSDIVEKTGFSKSNVSRTLDVLESMGLIEKRRRGMGNLIMLK